MGILCMYCRCCQYLQNNSHHKRNCLAIMTQPKTKTVLCIWCKTMFRCPKSNPRGIYKRPLHSLLSSLNRGRNLVDMLCMHCRCCQYFQNNSHHKRNRLATRIQPKTKTVLCIWCKTMFHYPKSNPRGIYKRPRLYPLL